MGLIKEFIYRILKKHMLNPLTINIDSPICKCKKQNVKPGFGSDYIFFVCRTCQTRLVVPVKNLSAYIIFNKPYPDGLINSDNILKLIPSKD